MEITGVVVKLTDEFLRIQTVKKKQEIDVFFSEQKKRAMEYRYQPHMITRIEVEPQSVELNGNKIAKLWLKYVNWPKLPEIEDRFK
ncbi:hypothetical protein [Chryseobacterium vrystaatense]|uniref:Uncharacterized protein n=1 Tax=Chryseobacterium vrystaatense TaxID=307480 RepID=A0ABR4UPF1_9FLAO|nr:hypothetical protein [Chryseobacterium vrystaatense]KFF26874.1 hypothetical protein IW16_06235 [Chryseobacterium vrystaatense]